ncbi:MAG: aldo/keto reductase [Acidobacteriota bacterium]|nr:aldo/keto reductase [Acidobacteriota bacterium]
MQYRNFGRLDFQVSALGFGCMRLPVSDGERLSPNIVEDEAIGMIRRAIDGGVNYCDTAYPYHSGASETLLGKALRDGYRERVKLATKLPVWQVEKPEDFDRILNDQLRKLQTDHIDFYLLHSLNQHRWRNLVPKYNMLEKAKAALADGRIRHLGFSMHDTHEIFAEIVNGCDLWDFCQIQYNYMDIENQAGTRGLKLAASKGLAVVVMEPLLGGRLADPPQPVLGMMAAQKVQRSAADWALQWLWDQPEVSVVLSGMSALPQVEENLVSASHAATGSFTAADHELIAKVREYYRTRTVVPCTKCGYCMPCPNGVKIPDNFDYFNYAHLFDDVKGARFKYSVFLSADERSGSCIECGECLEKCPQSIAISDWMPKVTALLA